MLSGVGIFTVGAFLAAYRFPRYYFQVCMVWLVIFSKGKNFNDHFDENI